MRPIPKSGFTGKHSNQEPQAYFQSVLRQQPSGATGRARLVLDVSVRLGGWRFRPALKTGTSGEKKEAKQTSLRGRYKRTLATRFCDTLEKGDFDRVRLHGLLEISF